MPDEDDELAAIRARKLRELQAANEPPTTPSGSPRAPVTVTDATLDGFVADHDAVVVDLWAPWCGPCRVIGPILDELAATFQGRVVVGKLNVDDNPATPGRYGVQGIPTLLLFKGGQLVDRAVGALPKAQLDALFQRLAA